MTSEVITTDALGRRSGPRRRRTLEEKRRIVEETLVPGASVATIARKYEVNANLVFGWRRMYQQGLLEVHEAAATMAMLPVQVTRPKRGKRSVTPPGREKGGGSIEIEFARGERIRIHGRVDAAALAKVIDLLAQR